MASLALIATASLLFVASCAASGVEVSPLEVAGQIVGEDGTKLTGIEVAGGANYHPYSFDPAVTETAENGTFLIEMPPVAERLDLNFVQVTVPAPGPDNRSTLPTHFRAEIDLGKADQRIVVPTPFSCDVDLEAALEAPSVCGTVLLPDLVPMLDGLEETAGYPMPQDSWGIDTDTFPGRTLLRLASATANLGAGMLHITPNTNAAGDRVPTWQRIWTDTAGFIDRPAGSFVFHPTHDHFHLDAFEQYRLLTLSGDVVAVGEKVSFCLIDVIPTIPRPSALGFGVYLETGCRAANDQQVLNPGWADYYGASLDDQWIDVTDVPPGDYLVEIIVDPNGILVESDELNNSATFPVTLEAPGS